MKSMKHVRRSFLVFFSLTLISAMISSCSSQYRPKERKETRTDTVAFRQIPPPPTYNRLSWTALEERVALNPKKDQSRPVISPVIQFEAKNETLDTVALMLRSATRYNTYVASSVSKRRVDIHMLGTLDEITENIQSQAKVRIVVDHTLQDIRILGEGYIPPRLISDSDLRGSTGSVYSGGKYDGKVVGHEADTQLQPKLFEVR